jgi:hypothetical protein
MRLALPTRRENTRLGDRILFSLTDVFLPEPQPSDAHSAEAPADESELEGTIIGFSDSGPLPRFFAVIGTAQKGTVVVPVDKLRLEPDENPGGKDLA